MAIFVGFISLTVLAFALSQVQNEAPEKDSDSQRSAAEGTDVQGGISIQDHEKNCEKWQTISLLPYEFEYQDKFTVKSGNLEGHVFTTLDVYDYNKKTYQVDFCACGIPSKPCIPLCCRADHKTVFKGAHLACEKMKNNATLFEDEDFAKYLMFTEKLDSKGFVIVNHNGEESMPDCATNQLVFEQGAVLGAHKLNQNDGIMSLAADETEYTPAEYCFTYDQKKKQFAPVYCQKPTKSKETAKSSANGIRTMFLLLPLIQLLCFYSV